MKYRCKSCVFISPYKILPFDLDCRVFLHYPDIGWYGIDSYLYIFQIVDRQPPITGHIPKASTIPLGQCIFTRFACVFFPKQNEAEDDSGLNHYRSLLPHLGLYQVPLLQLWPLPQWHSWVNRWLMLCQHKEDNFTRWLFRFIQKRSCKYHIPFALTETIIDESGGTDKWISHQ